MIFRARRRSELQGDAKGKQGLESDRAERIIPKRMHQEQRNCNYTGARLPTADFEIAEKSATPGQKEPAEKSQQKRPRPQPPLEQRFQKVVVRAIDEFRNESRRTFVE